MTIPDHLVELLTLLLRRAGLEPAFQDAEIVGYELEYVSGLRLLAVIMCREQKGWLGTRSVIDLFVYDASKPPPKSKALMFETVPFPRRPNDLIYGMTVTAKLTAMTRAVADTLGGGQGIS